MSTVKEILSRLCPEIDLDSCTSLVEDGILDSFSIITIVTELANDHEIFIPAKEIIPDNFNSAAALEALCERLQDE